MKSARQEKILEIIEKYEIETQNQLMERLRAEGVKSTQATLSRDIRDLHLVKEQKDGYSDYDTRLRKIFRESVVSYAVAQNLLIIKTLPGLANAACSALDSMSIPSLIGSIAGDDTAFIAMKDNSSAEHFYREIANLL